MNAYCWIFLSNIAAQKQIIQSPRAFFILRHIYKIWEQDSPLKRLRLNVFWPLVNEFRSRFYRCFLTFLNLIFFHQSVASLPQNVTEIVKFLETFKVWELIWESRWVFRKKLEFFKIAKCGNIPVECVQHRIISSKCLFAIKCLLKSPHLWQKIIKL